jgi:Xaa-Pro dipeptidase
MQQQAVAVCYDLARPGISLGELATRTEAIANGTSYQIHFLMHGRGLGDDAPIYVFSATEETKSWILEENASFIIKPIVTRQGHAEVLWGDSVVITTRGAERLGSITPEIIELT